jgi:diguanylate cyclase (GGDEF)-like protein
MPGLREELIDRARGAGLLVGSVASLLVPAWWLVDRVLAPEEAATFLAVRLLCDVPMLLMTWLLWRRPVGRRKPERLTFLILAVVQLEVAWMIPRVDQVHYYLLGFTLAIYGSGCVMVARPRWTAMLVAVTWIALAVSVFSAPAMLAPGLLVGAALYLGTASVVAMLAHQRRYALGNLELRTRIRLEHEQERTRILLAKLERLSHEDPLTGLANRRRWDAELLSACDGARRSGSGVSVVLLDIDHFKKINDRHGHGGGDEALRQVAGLLSGRVRAGDLVARLGGDELAVLMPGADLHRAVELAERLRLEAAQIQPEGFGPAELSLSLGVAAAAGDAAHPLELMTRADAQLYRAKITRNAVAAPHRDLRSPVLVGHPGTVAFPR